MGIKNILVHDVFGNIQEEIIIPIETKLREEIILHKLDINFSCINIIPTFENTADNNFKFIYLN